MIALRSYQAECIEHTQKAWSAGVTRVPNVLSTGAGKTVIFTHPSFVDPFLAAGERVLIIVHTDELCEQAAKKARQANPGRRIGIVKAARNEVTAQIIIASVQTLRNAKRREQVRKVGLMIIDECHHATAQSYRTVMEHFGAFDGRIKVAGFTATLIRGDKAKLSTVWETPPGGVFKRDLLYFIRHGYLLDVRGERVVVPDYDLGNVKKVAGDYSDSALADELERTFAPEIIAKHYAERAAGRRGIAFWPLVDTAYHGAEAFNEAGIPSAVIHGALPKEERRLILKRFATGEVQVIHNCMVLTEGFDAPWADVVVIARSTTSAALFQQMTGRVLRPDLTIPAGERDKALILDVVGAGARHDLRSLIDLAPERPLIDAEELTDDASLMELDDYLLDLDEQRAGATYEFEAPDDYAGDTAVVEFDPLQRDRLWAQTPAGTWYVGAGADAYSFLAESVEGDPGTYDVVLCSKNGYIGGPGWVRGTQHTALPLDMALGWAEEEALELGGFGAKELTGRKSAWRRKAQTEYPKMVGKARSMGIHVAPEWLAGDVSAAIDAETARRRIDPLVKLVRGS